MKFVGLSAGIAGFYGIIRIIKYIKFEFREMIRQSGSGQPPYWQWDTASRLCDQGKFDEAIAYVEKYRHNDENGYIMTLHYCKEQKRLNSGILWKIYWWI